MLALACWGIQLLLVSFARLDAIMISCLLISSPSPCLQRSERCEWVCEGLGLQIGVLMMSISKQACQVHRFNQRHKTRAETEQYGD
jgi:hypothetical protein